MENECIFSFTYGNVCKQQKAALQQNKDSGRVKTIIEASKKYGDGLCQSLEDKLREDQNVKINYHKNCVSRYTSKTNIKCNLPDQTETTPSPKKLRTFYSEFDFRLHCFYCGTECKIDKDPKHPDRWRQAYLCRSTWSESTKKPYKEFLLEKCNALRDGWGKEVRIRLEGALDLHAADARYHKDCLSKFYTIRDGGSDEHEYNQALEEVCTKMREEKTRIWNSVELYEMYMKCGGCNLNRKSLMKAIVDTFGDEIVMLTAPGYANLLAFST